MSASTPKLTVGFEWHQRLRTHKLFCDCPSELDREPDRSERRFLRLSSSELGEMDPAALLESQRSRSFEYRYSTDTACLVELDEAPPHQVNEDALRIALKVALMLKMKVLGEIRVMRKVVLDGSNTAGFQRTMLVAVGTDDSKVSTSHGDVRLATLCLEEESAFIVSTAEKEAVYRLDRLGIPLIELATHPDIHAPEQARELAEEVGLRLRLTGDVQRGIGSIRQDVNISVEGGSRQEVKGVQDLQLLDKIIELEGRRQAALLTIREELRRRKVELDKSEPFDVSEALARSGSSLIQAALKKGHGALCLPTPGLEGLLGTELVPGRRFGRELAEYAGAWAGVGGIVHSDELPAYGISEEETQAVRKACGLGTKGAFVLVLAEEQRARRALEVVLQRLLQARVGVPSETRKANEDGTTSYMRPLPGAARMYPETDLPPIVVSKNMIEEVAKALPPTPAELGERFIGLGLSEHAALQLVRSTKLEAFESAVSAGATPAVAASAILNIMPSLRREGVDVDSVSDLEIARGLADFCKLNLPNESLEALLRELASKGNAEDALSALRVQVVSEDEARRIIKQIVSDRADFVRKEGKGSVKALMGAAMEKLRGRVPGNEVHRILEEEVEAVL